MNLKSGSLWYRKRSVTTRDNDLISSEDFRLEARAFSNRKQAWIYIPQTMSPRGFEELANAMR